MTMAFFHGLLADRGRVEGFRRLIEAAVSPGDVVVEIGSGLGTFSFFAARAGARAVYGIESDPIVHVAQQIAKSNGVDDRVRFLRGKAPDVDIPERADILIFEDFPTRLLDQVTVRLLRACTDRYLEPGGRVLPGTARLVMAPVSHEPAWQQLFPFGPGEFEAYGIDFAATAGYVENAPSVLHLPEDALCGPAAVLAEITIHPPPTPSRLGGSVEWLIDRGPVHGLACWFELSAGDGTWIAQPERDRSPGGGVWGQVFLPFRTAMDATAGQRLEASVEVYGFSDGTPGWLSWTARSGDQTRVGHEFAAHPASVADLYPPAPAPDAGSWAPDERHPSDEAPTPPPVQ